MSLLLADPVVPPVGSLLQETVEGMRSMAIQDEGIMSREEHARRTLELSAKRSLTRAPRRGWTMMEHNTELDALRSAHGAALLATAHQAPIPENRPLPSPLTARPTTKPMQIPKVPPPRRSYSVTDKEPELAAPGQSRMTILDLPPEMHYDLFDFLDPIDGVCLGLTHSKLYTIHRRKYGKVPLCSRYSGPNDMEWVWRRAGSPLLRSATTTASHEAAAAAAAAGGNHHKRLDQLRVRGQVYCRKCGIQRCELHRHLRDWMGSGYEYCEVTRMYGRPAGAEARKYCFMSSPKNPHRCGRHGGKKRASEVVVSDEVVGRSEGATGVEAGNKK